MRLTQNFIRKDFAPLNISASIRVLSANTSPLMQSYDAILDEISPDRSLVPVTLLPNLELIAYDGSMGSEQRDDEGNVISSTLTPYSNENLVTDNSDYPMTWYANGKPIGSVFVEGKDFTIETTGEWKDNNSYHSRGQLQFFRNLKSNEQVEIYFDGFVRDKRTGQFVHVKTRPQLLATVDAGADQYTLRVNGPHNFTYNPVNDTLLLYDYLKANNLPMDDVSPEPDDASHVHTWTFDLLQGQRIVKRNVAADDPNKDNYVAANFAIAVYDKATNTKLDVDSTDGILAITDNLFTIDTRLRLSREYDLVATVHREADDKDVEVARVSLAYSTEYPTINATPLITTGYLPTDTYHSNAIRVNTMSKRKNGDNSPSATRLLYPDLYLDFEWHGVNSLGDDFFLGEGSEITYPISKVNVGDLEPEQIDSKNADNSIASCNYGEYCDGEWKEPLAIATDTDGDLLSDGESILAFI